MGRLRKRGRLEAWDEDPKPMDSVANLSDAMLVFACGLMISIAVNWNVDLKVQKVEVQPEQAVSKEDFNEAVSDSDDKALYHEVGKVYIDSETGEMYMIEEE